MKGFALLLGVLWVGIAEATYNPGAIQFAPATFSATMSNVATNYGTINESRIPNGSEALAQGSLPRFMPNLWVCNFSPAPGSGNTYTMTVRANAGNTDWSCTVADAATFCVDLVGTVIAESFSNWASTPVSTPTAANARCTLRGEAR